MNENSNKSRFIVPSDNDCNKSSSQDKLHPELKEIPPEEIKKVKKIMSYCAEISTFHSGPLPPASELQRYNEIIPNGADRIMKMAEDQSRHRMQLESIIIPSQTKQSARGQILGFVIAIFVVSAGVFCILKGHDTAGASLVVGIVVSLVGVFVLGKERQKKDLKEKKTDE